ncbi:LADA_0G05842g1_1 [Lachancea dasiensis]|uniref:LADA_0G05842g1_1 n=1 Tax=Lachancea dasiensis TaxID=1072105 RepID=A0A1G4JSW2_9SACH|nr:LADA_0G05842g1_1 [Lachancea dasiensis]
MSIASSSPLRTTGQKSSEELNNQNDVRPNATVRHLLQEVEDLQNEIFGLHRSLKINNEQIRKDIREFCSIGEGKDDLSRQILDVEK